MPVPSARFALLVAASAVALFFWAANHQQFDDLDSPAVLPLMEDEPPAGATASHTPATHPSPESQGESP